MQLDKNYVAIVGKLQATHPGYKYIYLGKYKHL